MKNYYDLFVDLSLQQCTKDDYQNKLKVKSHNVAIKKLQKLQGEMKKMNCIEVLDLLLLHEDDRVKINAASLCLQMGVFVDKAIRILEQIIKLSNDSTLSFSATILLKSYQNDQNHFLKGRKGGTT